MLDHHVDARYRIRVPAVMCLQDKKRVFIHSYTYIHIHTYIRHQLPLGHCGQACGSTTKFHQMSFAVRYIKIYEYVEVTIMCVRLDP